jgi:hypothetical protein
MAVWVKRNAGAHLITSHSSLQPLYVHAFISAGFISPSRNICVPFGA